MRYWPSRFDRSLLDRMTLRLPVLLGFAAVLWFGMASAWGMLLPIGGGHYSSVASTGIAAENMLKWHIWAPSFEVGARPQPAQYYCHHPFASYWVAVPTLFAFGHHDWALFAPAVILSVLTAYFIFDAARTVWGAAAGAAGVVAFAILPIALAYSNFQQLEINVIFGWSLFFWGYARLLARWKPRYVAASVAGALWTANADWIGFVAIAIMLGVALLRIYGPQRTLSKRRSMLYARWWIAVTCVIGITFVAYFVAFTKWGTINDLLGSGQARSSGGDLPLEQVLESRRYRINVCFTPAAIVLGKLAAPVALLRTILRRREEECFSLALLVSAVIQYVGFKQGADIHVFWPHHFALYFAFAMAQVAATLQGLVERGLSLAGVASARLGALRVACVAIAILALAILPDGLRGLYQGRSTWGRFNEERVITRSDEAHVVAMLGAQLPPNGRLVAGSGLDRSGMLAWALHDGAPSNAMSQPRRGDGATFFVARASSLSADELLKLAADWSLQFDGDILTIDERLPPGPASALTFDEREPNAIEWFLHGGTEPMRALVRDPFATWEWRVHLQEAAQEPSEPPRTLDQLRIAYNIAVLDRDPARAGRLMEQIKAQLTETAEYSFTKGVSIIGLRHIEGTLPRLEIWLRADQAPDGDWVLGTSSRVVARAFWSTVPPDKLVRDMTEPFRIPSRLWKSGFLYVHTVELYHRTGKEIFSVGWRSRDGSGAPSLRDGRPLDLLTVP